MKSYNLIKPEIRIIGLDDTSFIPHSKGKIGVIGVVFRGGYWLEDLMKTEITIDGFDATENISSMIINSPHYQQLQLIMLNGIMFGGFNIVNMKQLSLTTKLPILSVIRKKPVFSSIQKALRNFPNFKERWKAILDAGKIIETTARNSKSKIYFQAIGISEKDAQKIIRLTSTMSNIPEVLRVAHIVASGIGSI
ncbi:MAG: DUF99 family protein [Candidatus Bathyarchaeota archaeon]|nr:DUF99 family protein [Candidatus Bathyarchaeota archaeon]